MLNILYIVLAISGLGFLVFIHELGHYIVAKRQGMKIETFAIGFGKPIFSWVRNGVKWQVGWLPFGGYVKIAGMQTENGQDPYEIKEGFFTKTPLQRMKVAFAGPFVNIVFAFIAFAGIWMMGGREKPFSELTHKMGWVDPKSGAFEKGLRPGDTISSIDGKKYQDAKALMYASVLKKPTITLRGEKIDYYHNHQIPFDYRLQKYPHPDERYQNKLNTFGILSMANYIVLGEPSPETKEAGIAANDQLIWADGELIFSLEQLSTLINESTSFVTVKRGSEIFHTKVPRVQIQDLQISHLDREEINDWKHEANISTPLSEIYVLPFGFNDRGIIEKSFAFVDQEQRQKAINVCVRCDSFEKLKMGDQILAIDGQKVSSTFDLLRKVQDRNVLTIVSKNASQKLTLSDLQQQFTTSLHVQDVYKIVQSIGTDKSVYALNGLLLTKPLTPKKQKDVNLGPLQIQEYLRQIEDPDIREQQRLYLDKEKEKLVLGLQVQNKMVQYNPNPAVLMRDAFQETWFTLSSLVTGNLNPKWLAGPVGIVQISHISLSQGVTEALFWLGFISLNLGLVNLLPIPVLDGGYITLSLFEMITKKRLKAKTMERLIIPFVILLIGGLIYVTYHDLTRLFS